MNFFTLVQAAYRGRNDDGTETTATWKAATNIGWAQDVDVPFRVRIGVTETGGVTGTLTPDLQHQVNGGGWVNTTATVAAAHVVASGNVTDNATTTQQITSGSFAAGRVEETGGTATGVTLTSQSTEYEWVVQLDSGSLSNGDTVEFRLVNAGVALDSYGQTPTVTANVPLPPDIPVKAVEHNDLGQVTTITIPKPAGTAEGDEMWVHMILSNSSGTVDTIPTGWTEHADAANVDYTYALYSKICGAAEPTSWDWVASGASFTSAAIVIAENTAQNETAPVISAVGGVNTVTVAPTTTVDGSILVFFVGTDVSDVRDWTNDEATATELFDVTTATEFLSHAGFAETAPTAGTYSRSFTVSGSAQDMHAVAIILAPASAPAGPVVKVHIGGSLVTATAVKVHSGGALVEVANIVAG